MRWTQWSVYKLVKADVKNDSSSSTKNEFVDNPFVVRLQISRRFSCVKPENHHHAGNPKIMMNISSIVLNILTVGEVAIRF